jgi:hypothetical protein
MADIPAAVRAVEDRGYSVRYRCLKKVPRHGLFRPKKPRVIVATNRNLQIFPPGKTIPESTFSWLALSGIAREKHLTLVFGSARHHFGWRQSPLVDAINATLVQLLSAADS